jgi:hypothetical protein
MVGRATTFWREDGMFDTFAELLRGLAISLLIALVLLLALPGAKAGPYPAAAFGPSALAPGH